MDQDATWHEGRPQPRRLCVRWVPSPIPQKGRSHTQFSAHLYCGQTAAWIKMPLGTDVGLGLYATLCSLWTQLPPEKKAHPPHAIFGPCLLWPNGWMDELTPLGTEIDLGPGHIVLDGVPAPAKGAQQPPLFAPCLLWPRSPISATAELLLINVLHNSAALLLGVVLEPFTTFLYTFNKLKNMC